MKSRKGIFSTATAAISMLGVHANIQMHVEKLDNGLTIVILPTKTKGIMQFAIVYLVGSSYDDQNVIGISHFLEHMMFKGTIKLSAIALNKLLNKYTSEVNAFTSEDITVFYCKINPIVLPIILRIEADRMQNLKLDESEVKSERDVVADERNMRFDASAQTRYIFDACLSSLFLQSNYRTSVIGLPAHIANFDRNKLLEHYQKYYAPDNAIIVISGDISDCESVVKEVKKYFGKIKKRCGKKPERPVDPPKTGIRYFIDHTSPQLATKQLNIVYTFSRKNIDTLRRLMMAKIVVQALCGNRRSVLYKKFVDGEQKLYSIHGMLDIKEIDKIIFYIEAIIHNELNRKDVETQIYVAVDRFITNDFTEDLFNKVKSEIVRSITFLHDNPSALLFNAIEHIVLGYEKDFANIAEITDSITYEETLQYAKSILSSKHRTHVFYSHPEEKAKQSRQAR